MGRHLGRPVPASSDCPPAANALPRAGSVGRRPRRAAESSTVQSSRLVEGREYRRVDHGDGSDWGGICRFLLGGGSTLPSVSPFSFERPGHTRSSN